MFAQSIHNESNRRTAPFAAINCAALPENLLESELFGYVKGAFTGARDEGKMGVFELAHTGTLFLDEISEILPAVQARLLRVLQEKEITRVGDDKVISINVRIIAASNKNLLAEIRRGAFRRDLFYRLCVLPLYIIPLRERPSDILPIAYAILANSSRRNIAFTPEAESLLAEYDWPGNVRELSNCIERLLILYDYDCLGKEDVREVLDLNITDISRQSDSLFINGQLGRRHIKYTDILEALNRNNGNRKTTAQQLGISTTTLWRWLKRGK